MEFSFLLNVNRDAKNPNIPKSKNLKIPQSQNFQILLFSHFWKVSFPVMLLPLMLILYVGYGLSSHHVTDNDLKTGNFPGCSR